MGDLSRLRIPECEQPQIQQQAPIAIFRQPREAIELGDLQPQSLQGL